MSTLAKLQEGTARLGKVIDEVRALKKESGVQHVSVTDPLQAAVRTLEEAQRALTYELGVAARVEYANRPRAAEAVQS